MSCVVLDVTQGAQRIVVKQALGRLRVADEWLAPTSRAVTEADALRLGAELTPGAVPRVLDSDPDNSVLVIERAPQDWRDWKQALLEGDADTDVAAWLGFVCATWHSGTLDDRAVEAAFAHREAFESLRIDPYYRTVAVRHPELRPAITAAIGRLEAGRCCLVHGDFSPKNVLVGDGRTLGHRLRGGPLRRPGLRRRIHAQPPLPEGDPPSAGNGRLRCRRINVPPTPIVATRASPWSPPCRGCSSRSAA